MEVTECCSFSVAVCVVSALDWLLLANIMGHNAILSGASSVGQFLSLTCNSPAC